MIQQLFTLIMQMNSRRSNKDKLICLAFAMIIGLVIFVILDLMYIVEYSNLRNKIDNYQHNPYSYRCYDLCNYYSYDKGDQCCYDPSYTDCTSRSQCISRMVSQLQIQQDSASSKIWIFSSLGGFFLLFAICLCQGKEERNRHRNNRVPLINPQSGLNINHSHEILNKNKKRVDIEYESFAYVDEETTCCICLEPFNNQKAILLKCGHIFHSSCIRDWSIKQQNCPVCRSSQ